MACIVWISVRPRLNPKKMHVPFIGMILEAADSLYREYERHWGHLHKELVDAPKQLNCAAV
jgi:hypothetical protein